MRWNMEVQDIVSDQSAATEAFEGVKYLPLLSDVKCPFSLFHSSHSRGE